MESSLQESETAFQRKFYIGFVAVLFACFSPLKSFSYALPTIFCAGLLLTSAYGVSRARLCAGLGVWLALGLVYTFIEDEFIVSNYALSLITYSAFIPILIIDSRHLASRALLRRLLSIVSAMIAFQGVYGIIQALYGATQTGSFGGANGDYVQGTIYPQLAPENAFSNPMFAVNMTLMLLACMSSSEMTSGRRRSYLIVGTASVVLASVVHVLVFLALAFLAAFILIRSRRRTHHRAFGIGRRRTGRANAVLMLALGGALSYVALADNLAQVGDYVARIVDIEGTEIPRAIMLYRVAYELPDDAPVQPWVGLGPGQFSSRASLIASGLYLGGPDNPATLPFLKPTATELTDDYCLSLLRMFSDNYSSFGATNQPFCSVLSMYTEMGLLGVLLFGWVIVRALRNVRARAVADPSITPLAFFFTVGTVFVVLIGLVENYWEVPQAILVGLLLLKVMYANIMHCSVPRKAESIVPATS